jgi:predicted HTH transcriptional regulator
VDCKKIHPKVLELTTEERQAKVQTAKQRNPSATVSELARLTDMPRKTVHDILKNPIAKTKPVNSFEVAQFLRERA